MVGYLTKTQSSTQEDRRPVMGEIYTTEGGIINPSSERGLKNYGKI
jgi:hypothetical protein